MAPAFAVCKTGRSLLGPRLGGRLLPIPDLCRLYQTISGLAENCNSTVRKEWCTTRFDSGYGTNDDRAHPTSRQGAQKHWFSGGGRDLLARSAAQPVGSTRGRMEPQGRASLPKRNRSFRIGSGDSRWSTSRPQNPDPGASEGGTRTKPASGGERPGICPRTTSRYE